MMNLPSVQGGQGSKGGGAGGNFAFEDGKFTQSGGGGSSSLPGGGGGNYTFDLIMATILIVEAILIQVVSIVQET